MKFQILPSIKLEQRESIAVKSFLERIKYNMKINNSVSDIIFYFEKNHH